MTARPVLAALILAAAFAQAETSDELLSAQAAFRQALSEQNSIGSKLTFAEEKLTNARQRKAAAEADIQTYTQQLEQMQQQPPTTPPCNRRANASTPPGRPPTAAVETRTRRSSENPPMPNPT